MTARAVPASPLERTPRDRSAHWAHRLRRFAERAREPTPAPVEGKLVRIVGLTLEAAGCRAAIGDQCRVQRAAGGEVTAEVVGFSGGNLLLTPIGQVRGLAPLAAVVPARHTGSVRVGDALLGRVIDGAGEPIDGRGRLRGELVDLSARPINPLQRRPIRAPLDVGVRSVNALLTVGRGQRLGLLAPSGVGKSVLLGMMARFTEADVVVVGLVGERGREVNDFIYANLGARGLGRAVVVVSPADDPPLMRVQGARLATRIAEHFRDRGLEVLLLIDSFTRYAQAHRQIALALGEPPAIGGYPPSVFARLPLLTERAGNLSGAGGITAFYTVLAESSESDDPVSEAARALLDGHLVLSRKLADAGHFPAIDIEASISRTMRDVASATHVQNAGRFRRLWSAYETQADLINVGAYVKGADVELDRAIELRPGLVDFLRQDLGERVALEPSVQALESLLESAGDPS